MNIALCHLLRCGQRPARSWPWREPHVFPSCFKEFYRPIISRASSMMRERKSSMEPNAHPLNQPCPYRGTSGKSVRASGRISLPKLSIFEKFRYSRVGRRSAEERGNEDDESSTQPMDASLKTANTRERWFMLIFSLLLMPSLLNLSLVFNGPVAVKGDHHATSHRGFRAGKT
jgi:hypothetical protein